MNNFIDENNMNKTESANNDSKSMEKAEVLFTFARKSCGCGGNCNGSCK